MQRCHYHKFITTRTIISVFVLAVLMTSETILNYILAVRMKNNYIIYILYIREQWNIIMAISFQIIWQSRQHLTMLLRRSKEVINLYIGWDQSHLEYVGVTFKTPPQYIYNTARTPNTFQLQWWTVERVWSLNAVG